MIFWSASGAGGTPPAGCSTLRRYCFIAAPFLLVKCELQVTLYTNGFGSDRHPDKVIPREVELGSTAVVFGCPVGVCRRVWHISSVRGSECPDSDSLECDHSLRSRRRSGHGVVTASGRRTIEGDGGRDRISRLSVHRSPRRERDHLQTSNRRRCGED